MGEMFEDSHDYTILDKSGWPIDSGTLDQLKEKSKYWGTELNLFVLPLDDARTFCRFYLIYLSFSSSKSKITIC